MHPDLLYRIALGQVPNVGNVLAKNLVSYCGSAEAIFKQTKARLLKIPGIGEVIAAQILAFKDFTKAQAELDFIIRHKIQPIFYADAAYPERLKNITDSPALLYSMGNARLDAERMVAIVGTRKASDYGKDICAQLVEGLKPYNCTIVSGLAYGIDIAAHKAALQHNMPTIGVLAHGLDRIYPPTHANTAKKMLENGALLTEYTSGTNPDREKFPARNRIVAGLCNAVIVIETDLKGGSMITAEIAFGYNRDVFAIPGRTIDEKSKGCNHLIKVNKAALIESAADIAYQMGWEITAQPQKKKAPQLNLTLSDNEAKVVHLLNQQESMGIDDICHATRLSLNETALILLELELNGTVKSLPGKVYKLC